jgi:hypothetical protein
MHMLASGPSPPKKKHMHTHTHPLSLKANCSGKYMNLNAQNYIDHLGYYTARNFIHIFRYSQHLVFRLQPAVLNHIMLKANTKVSKEQSLYL